MARLSFSAPPKARKRDKDWLLDNLYCQFCAYCVSDHEALQIEHYIPKSLGQAGTDNPSNLLLACATCNGPAGKSDYHPQRPKPGRGLSDFEVINIKQDDFEKVFSIDKSGNISSKSFRGNCNIALLKLDRSSLRESRVQYLGLLEDASSLRPYIEDNPDLKVVYDKTLRNIEKLELFYHVFGIAIPPRLAKISIPTVNEP